MKTLNHIALVFACCLAFSCNNVSRDVKEFVITDYSFTDWKHLLEIEKVVQLSENDSCLLSNAAKCIITNSHILFGDNKSKRLYSFSHDGKYICTIGNIGRAKNEYMRIKDCWLCSSDSSVMVLDERGIVSYNLKNGDYVDRLKLKSSNSNEYGRIMPVANSEYLCFKNSGDGNSIVLDSPKGIKGLRKSRRYSYVLSPFYEYNGEYRVLSDYGDFYIDSYEDGALQPLYQINLGSEALPDEILPKTRKEFQTVDNSPNYFKCILDACETSKWICLNLVGPNNEYYVAFLDKVGNKHVCGKNNEDVGFYVTGAAGDSFWALVYPEYLSDQSFAKKILQTNRIISNDKNTPILIKFRINENSL